MDEKQEISHQLAELFINMDKFKAELDYPVQNRSTESEDAA